MLTPALLEMALAGALLAVYYPRATSLRRRWQALQRFRARQAENEDYPKNGLPLFSSISGIQADGEAALLTPSPRDRRYVLFVLHANTLDGDLAFWEQVQSQLRPGAAKLVGYCDGAECVRELGHRRPAPSLVAIGYTQYHTARVLLQADRAHAALIVHADLSLAGTVSWSAEASSAATAAAVEAVK